MFWFHMCYTTASQEKPYLLFGTNVKGLAIVYGGPKKSVLFHTDIVEGKNTYVFLARRKDLMGGLVELVFRKLFKSQKLREISPKTELLKTMSYELSL